jgi:hypothetical protein
MREEKERREEYPWPVESRACSGKSFENPSIWDKNSHVLITLLPVVWTFYLLSWGVQCCGMAEGSRQFRCSQIPKQFTRLSSLVCCM